MAKNCLLSIADFLFLNSKQSQYKLTEAAKDPLLSMLLAITFENFEKLCQVTLVMNAFF